MIVTCPFCGAPAEITETNRYHGTETEYWTECTSYHCGYLSPNAKSLDKAIALNRFLCGVIEAWDDPDGTLPEKHEKIEEDEVA